MTLAEVAATVISALFAGISSFAAIVAYRSSEASTRSNFRLEWTRDVIAWGTRAVDAMAIAQSLCECSTNEEVEALPSRYKLVAELSALIDEGRFFFENEAHPTYGAGKPKAYQGYRPIMLDFLVAAHDILKAAPMPQAGDTRVCQELWAVRREFVSALQGIIEPRWLSKEASYNRTVNSNA
jgi:hypothetical protein